MVVFFWSEVNFVIIISTFEKILFFLFENQKIRTFQTPKFSNGQKFSYVHACVDFLKTSKSGLFRLLNFQVIKNHCCTHVFFFENLKILTFQTPEFSSGQKFSYVYAREDFLKTSKYELFRLLNFPVVKNPHVYTHVVIFWKPQNSNFSGPWFL